MTTSALIARLIRHEGLRLKPYRDSAGKLTIGAGRNLDDVGVSRAEAVQLLMNDIDRAEAALDLRFPWWRRLDGVRQDVMAELAFNLGIAGLAGFARTLQAVEAGRYAEAGDQLLASRWAGEVGGRARELAQMMRTGRPPPADG